MRIKSLFGKLIQLKSLPPSLWHSFTSGWLHRQQSGFVPCAVKGCNKLLNVPLRDFYESYEYFCETLRGNAELVYFLKRLKPHEVFYDVGAFRGAYSVISKLKLQENISAHAFEPIAKNVEAMRRICVLNRFEDCKIVPLAVGNGTLLTGRLSEQDVVMFRLGDDEASPAEIEFPAISLDEYIAQGAPPPTLIKIDVEGFELEVLRGACECLAKHHPRLWLEIHPKFLEAQNNSPDKVLNLLREIGYSISFFHDYNPSNPRDTYHVWCA
jgi:FkbM family methyltransferase